MYMHIRKRSAEVQIYHGAFKKRFESLDNKLVKRIPAQLKHLSCAGIYRFHVTQIVRALNLI